MLRLQRKDRSKKLGQVMIEFTLCMIIVFLMIYSLTKIFEWSGREFTDRRQKHDTVLRSTGTRGYVDPADSEQIKQISPYFSGGSDMNAIWTN
ncbi:MAG: hypothetical protein AB7S78_05230 [Candidatus Omnitrophota bacterium]